MVLQSQRWREFSASLRVSGVCDACMGSFDPSRLAAHHWHYETLGDETPWDVSALCLECHAFADVMRRAIVAAAKECARENGDDNWARTARLVGRELVRIARRPALTGHLNIVMRALRYFDVESIR